jgi:hypothetical protein
VAEVATAVAPPLPAVERDPRSRRCSSGAAAASSPQLDDGREAVELVRDDGVLRWVYQPPPAARSGGDAWRAIGVDRRDVVQRFEYPPLGRNQHHRGAGRAGPASSTTGAGCGAGSDGAWQPVGAQTSWRTHQGRVLLLVHGTFSKSAMYDSELTAPGWTDDGAPSDANQALWNTWTTPGKPYAAVLAFDHATLSLAPWLNALELVKTGARPAAPRTAKCDWTWCATAAAGWSRPGR